MQFWRNPELVRHARAELRPARALTTGLLVLVICLLTGLACWSAEPDNFRQFTRTFYGWLVGIQFVALGFWCASACGQAISRERELKTLDFLKTTRLTAGELVLGKLLGAPILAYFSLACMLPISLLAGIFGGYSLRVLFGTYLLLLALMLFVGLIGLWISLLREKSSGAVGAVGLLPIVLTFGLTDSPFPGAGAISIFPALFSLYGLGETASVTPKLFGMPSSFPFLTLFLYAAFGAWLVLMLTRNFKRDLEQVRLLSRWQALGFAIFLNALFYGFLDMEKVSRRTGVPLVSPEEASTLAVVMNTAILFLLGLATVVPREKLKVCWRKRAAAEVTYLTEDGLPWPWLAMAALVAYSLLVGRALAGWDSIPFASWNLGKAAVQLLVFLLFISRDILFLQWCNLTRMKRPLVKGFFYLLLYYTAVFIIGGVLALVWALSSSTFFALTSPFTVFGVKQLAPAGVPEIYLGMALQVGVIWFLLRAISHRLGRSATATAASGSASES